MTATQRRVLFALAMMVLSAMHLWAQTAGAGSRREPPRLDALVRPALLHLGLDGRPLCWTRHTEPRANPPLRGDGRAFHTRIGHHAPNRLYAVPGHGSSHGATLR